MGNLAAVRLAGGDAPGARAALRAVVSLARTAGDRRAEIAAQVDLRIVELRIGDAAAAGTHFKQAIALVRELGDRRDEVTTRIEVGRAHLSAADGRTAQARTHGVTRAGRVRGAGGAPGRGRRALVRRLARST